jgi:uncharacterized protein YegP (UPF0339 family)
MKPEFYVDAEGDYRWRIRARNGRIVAEGGEGYVSEAKARHGFHVAAKGMAVFLGRYGKKK